MSTQGYNVVRCTECDIITVKRTTVKKPGCVCGAVNKFTVLKHFPTAREATRYIQALKGTPSSREFVFGGAFE